MEDGILLKLHWKNQNANTLQAPDDELMALVDVANIACGFHAGDPSLMRKTVSLAKLKKVRVGAHPGLQGTFSTTGKNKH